MKEFEDMFVFMNLVPENVWLGYTDETRAGVFHGLKTRKPLTVDLWLRGQFIFELYKPNLSVGEPSKIGKKKNLVFTLNKKVGKVHMMFAKAANIIYLDPRPLSDIKEYQFYSKGVKSVYDDDTASFICIKPKSQIPGTFFT